MGQIEPSQRENARPWLERRTNGCIIFRLLRSGRLVAELQYVIYWMACSEILGLGGAFRRSLPEKKTFMRHSADRVTNQLDAVVVPLLNIRLCTLNQSVPEEVRF